MATTLSKNKRDNDNNSIDNAQSSNSFTDNTDIKLEHDNTKENNIDDIYAHSAKKDRLILPKRTFIDIDSLDCNTDAESNNDYELVDSDDDLAQQQTRSDDDDKNTSSKPSVKRKRSTTNSLSLSPMPKIKHLKSPLPHVKQELEEDNHNGNDDTATAAASSNGHEKNTNTTLPATTEDSVISPKVEETAINLPNRPSENGWDPGSKYEVESILQHKIYRNRVLRYEVKWKGYPHSENTWESAASLHEAFVLKYWRSLPDNVMRPKNIPLDAALDFIDSELDSMAAPTTTKTGNKNSPLALTNEVISLDDDDEEQDFDDNIGEFTDTNDDDDTLFDQKESNGNWNYSSGDSDYDVSEMEVINSLTAECEELNDLSTTGTKDDKYRAISRAKNIRQKDMATNFKNRYQFIYADTTQVDADALDWTDKAMIIRNILPLKTHPTQLMAYLRWSNNVKTVHLIQELHEKCPHKLLHYYEDRIHFYRDGY